MKKMLVVYYSVSNGNTKGIAEQIQNAVGADIARIETVMPYTGTYDEIVAQGQREVNQGYQPEIRPLAVNPEEYDVIVVGTPTWWYAMAPAVQTFLKEHNWQGKVIIPFQTHGGWPGHAIKDIKAACKGADVVNEMEIQFDSTGGSHLETPEDKLMEWMEKIKRELK